MAPKADIIIPVERIENLILLLRGQKVIIDSDLAQIYGVTTRRLNEQVRRNMHRFPADFMFQLNAEEFKNLKSQFATSSSGWGGRRKLPYAFTEHGAIMAASVLNTDRAVAVSVYVVRAFIKLRQMLAPYKELMQKLRQIERRLQAHDEQIEALNAIRQLMLSIEEGPKEPIGFLAEAKKQTKNRKVKKKKTKAKKRP